MRWLIPIFLFGMLSPLCGQDTRTTEPDEATFGDKLKETFDFTEKLELFSVISSSRTKCELLVIDDEEIWTHQGKTIRQIDIEVIDPFGHVDPESLRRPKFFKLANSIHQTSRSRFIREDLLFREGEKLDPEKVVASHEILYDNDYYRDAMIYVREVEGEPDVVDIYVLVQDLWSWSFWGDATGEHIGGKLAFHKFAGLPQTLIGGMNFNYDRHNPVTPSLQYDYRNIKGTFLRARAEWIHDWENYTYEASIRRGFFSSKPQWAGGIRTGWYRNHHDEYDDRSYHNSQDFWLARSFPLNVGKAPLTNLVVAGRAIRMHYTDAPEDVRSEDGSFRFSDQNSYYFGIGVANRRYIQERHVFDFFPYRNLPVGFNMHLIGGVTYHDRHSTRGYVGVTANHSLMTCAGYFQEEFAAGSYLHQGMEQVTISIKSKYFTHRLPLRKWGIRQYVYQSLVYGLQRPDGENVVIGNGGVKGIRFKDYEGSSYYTLNLETEIHSPVKFIGFQARIFAFADFGLQGNRSDVPLASPRVYQAYGMGIRLNNWKLGLGFLEFAFVYYPNTSGLHNRPFEFSQNFYNSKEIVRNNLYQWESLAPVN